MPRRGGIKARLDRVEGNAHATLNQARQTAITAEEAVEVLREALLGLIEEFQDGVIVVLVRKENACTLMEFLSGQGKEFPIGIRIDVREDEPEPEPVK